MSKIIFELNEFNIDLLEKYKNDFSNIKKFLNKNIYRTKIKNDYNSNFLEPWSQWISIHTGVPADEHKIQHLGDCSFNKKYQAWEINSDINLVWGCLNSSHGSRKEVLFFPDPWCITQNTNIKDTENILYFLRLAVQGRSKKNTLPIFYFGLRALISYIKILKLKIFKTLPFITGIRSTSEIYGIFEYLNLQIFLQIQKKQKVNTSIFFANILAHFQHYYWSNKNENKIKWCLKLVDNMLEDISEVTENVTIINGLSQENTEGLENFFSYIPNGGFENFFKKFNLNFNEVIPCMSYDCIISFNTMDEKNKFIEQANNFVLSFNKAKLFLIDDYDGVERIFLRMNYYGEKKVNFLFNQTEYNFEEYFNVLAKRTGRHIQRCDIISSEKISEKKFAFNEEINKIFI